MVEIADEQLLSDKLTENSTEIGLLRRWADHQSHIPTTIKDEEILMFLHSCYYNLKATEKCLSTYYNMRASVPDFFCDRHFMSGPMRNIQDVVKFCFLPERTDKGWAVLMAKLVNYEPSQLHLESAIKLLFMHVDTFLLAHPLVPGIIFVYDSQGIALGHLTRLNLSTVRKYLTYVQEAMPLRLKEIRVLNVNNVISHIMTLIKPFIHKNHLQHIKLHSPGDLADMYEKIPRHMLPKDYDGEEASFSTLNKLAITQLTDCLNLFEEEEKGLAELNKNLKKTKTNSTFTIEGSFKKLDLD